MSDIQIRPSRNVSKADFDLFARDLELFLGAFTPQLLADWLRKDKGNLSRKLHGSEPITRNDIRDFYGRLSAVMAKLKSGVNAFQIELEMESPREDECPVIRNTWEEIRLIHEKMGQLHRALAQLQDRFAQLQDRFAQLQDRFTGLHDRRKEF
jgi:hypothetical protein